MDVDAYWVAQEHCDSDDRTLLLLSCLCGRCREDWNDDYSSPDIYWYPSGMLLIRTIIVVGLWLYSIIPMEILPVMPWHSLCSAWRYVDDMMMQCWWGNWCWSAGTILIPSYYYCCYLMVCCYSLKIRSLIHQWCGSFCWRYYCDTVLCYLLSVLW